MTKCKMNEHTIAGEAVRRSKATAMTTTVVVEDLGIPIWAFKHQKFLSNVTDH